MITDGKLGLCADMTMCDTVY